MVAVTELYQIVNERIEAIADEVEALCDELPETPIEEYPRIDQQIADLTNEHNELIPKWKSLRWLLDHQKAS